MGVTDRDRGTDVEADIASFLSDAQWEELRRLSTLPNEAREDVAYECIMARQFYEAEQPKAQQRRRKLIREAADLAAKLATMAVEIREANVIWSELDLEAEKDLLKKLDTFENRMRIRIKNFRTGPVTDGFHMVIEGLNFTLLHHCKRPLTLSNKDKGDGFNSVEFVVKVCEFAGVPNHGTGLRSKVRNGIKALVDKMAHWDPEYRPGLRTKERRYRQAKKIKLS